MTNARIKPRHRLARRPIAAVTDLSHLSPSRGVALASVTGLALTTVVTGAAQAAPAPAIDATANTTSAAAPTEDITVSVPDIAWKASDEVGATAEAPVAAAPAEEAAAATDTGTGAATAASRSEGREALDASAAVNPSGSSIVSIAMQYLGVPYVSGGSSPAGFDCSGLTQYVYGLAGISLPRTAQAQGYAGTFVSAAEAQPGDLVWHSYGHVGIYAGNGMVIEATKPGDVVKIQALWGNYSFVRF